MHDNVLKLIKKGSLWLNVSSIAIHRSIKHPSIKDEQMQRKKYYYCLPLMLEVNVVFQIYNGSS